LLEEHSPPTSSAAPCEPNSFVILSPPPRAKDLLFAIRHSLFAIRAGAPSKVVILSEAKSLP